MNITLKFLGNLNHLNYLKDFSCSNCHQPFTDHDLNQKNYLLGISDYANEINQFHDARHNPVYEVRL